MKVKELIALLESDGWFQVPTKPGTVTVSGKPNLDIPPGTLNSALKQSGLKKPE